MITILCGKSACGKDSILRELVKNQTMSPLISHTSRPIREGEIEGREYHFVGRDTFEKMIQNDRMIEYRSYTTKVGGRPDTWYYGLSKESIDKDAVKENDYVVILDLEGAKNLIDYLGKDRIFVCYVEAGDEIRTQRANSRGSFDEEEWNRRLLADKDDFSETKVADIADYRLVNEGTLSDSVSELKNVIASCKERMAKGNEQALLSDICDVVHEYKNVIDSIRTTYDTVLKDLNASKQLVEENEKLRMENCMLKEMLKQMEYDKQREDYEEERE